MYFITEARAFAEINLVISTSTTAALIIVATAKGWRVMNKRMLKLEAKPKGLKQNLFPL